MFSVSDPRTTRFSAFRRLARPFVQTSRALPVRLAILGQNGTGPRAVFLPSAGREGAARLRIHAVAERFCDHGWQALVLPSSLGLAQRHRLLAAARPDVLVMQGVRHSLNRPGFYPGLPIVMDMDDADFHLPHLAAPLAAAMPQVSAVVAGSDYVRDWCLGQGVPLAGTVWTGMPVSPGPRVPQHARPFVVAWAQTRPASYVREAGMVLELMSRLAAVHPGVRLRLYDRRPDDDPGFLSRFEAAGISTEWRAAMPFERYLASFDDVALGLAPLSAANPFSRGKSVGKVLAYLDRHVPVIASDAGEHGRIFDAGTAVLSNDMDVLAGRAAALLASANTRQRMAGAGFDLFRRQLSSDAAAGRVVGLLNTLLPASDRMSGLRLSG